MEIRTAIGRLVFDSECFQCLQKIPSLEQIGILISREKNHAKLDEIFTSSLCCSAMVAFLFASSLSICHAAQAARAWLIRSSHVANWARLEDNSSLSLCTYKYVYIYIYMHTHTHTLARARAHTHIFDNISEKNFLRSCNSNLGQWSCVTWTNGKCIDQWRCR